jgi:hypothetical protein
MDLNGSVGSIAELKPKGPEFESRIRQGYSAIKVFHFNDASSVNLKFFKFWYEFQLNL